MDGSIINNILVFDVDTDKPLYTLNVEEHVNPFDALVLNEGEDYIVLTEPRRPDDCEVCGGVLRLRREPKAEVPDVPEPYQVAQRDLSALRSKI
jgi:hypothetical protein